MRDQIIGSDPPGRPRLVIGRNDPRVNGDLEFLSSIARRRSS